MSTISLSACSIREEEMTGVGSSRNSSTGSFTRAGAGARLCLWPLDSVIQRFSSRFEAATFPYHEPESFTVRFWFRKST